MTIMRDALVQSRRKNIERYSRMLATKLSFAERRYLHKRIAQERAELERLQLHTFRDRSTGKSDVATVGAAQSLRRIDGASPKPSCVC